MKNYGVEIVPRPKIAAKKLAIDLSSKKGEETIKSLTYLVLIRHKKTFDRLSNM